MISDDAAFWHDLQKLIFPDCAESARISVRLRSKPVMVSVKNVHVPAYVLGCAYRKLYSVLGENVSFEKLNIFLNHLSNLVGELLFDSSVVSSFDSIQLRSVDCLRKAFELTMTRTNSASNDASCPGDESYRTGHPSVTHVSISSLLNKRRRQEDRWFFTPNLIAYAPVSPSRCIDSNCPVISGFGVFDGHNGPEAAEHCANLAPFLLSRRLQKRFLMTRGSPHRSRESLPDMLANVIDQLNFSVSESHKEKLWNSGTTATICLVYGGFIYTAWIGDSQAVFFSNSEAYTSSSSSVHKTMLNRSVFDYRSNSLPPRSSGYEDQGQISSSSSRQDHVRTSPFYRLHLSDTALHHPCLNSHETSCLRTASVSEGCFDVRPAGDLRCQTISVARHSGVGKDFRLLTTHLHRPENASEFVSIIRSGGCVTFKAGTPEYSPFVTSFEEKRDSNPRFPPPVMADNTFSVPCLNASGVYRVGGVSGVSRSVGAKSNGIRGMSSLPSLSCFRIPQAVGSACIILASDGFWDTTGCSAADTVSDIFSVPPMAVNSQINNAHSTPTCLHQQDYAKILSTRAVRNGSGDNVTVLVIWLSDIRPSSSSVTMDLSHCAALSSRLNRTLSFPFLSAKGHPDRPRRNVNQDAGTSNCQFNFSPPSLSLDNLNIYEVSRFRLSSPMHVV